MKRYFCRFFQPLYNLVWFCVFEGSFKVLMWASYTEAVSNSNKLNDIRGASILWCDRPFEQGVSKAMQNASHRTHFRVSCIMSCVGGQTPVLTRNSRAQKKTLSTESPCESICCSNYIPGATKFPRQGGVEGGRREGPWTREGPEGVPRALSARQWI